MKLSIIIPVLNEAHMVNSSLERLVALRKCAHEIIIVDGGSRDQTLELVQSITDQVLVSHPGRAIQMNCGAALATGDVLLFLHVDTQLPDIALSVLEGEYAKQVQLIKFWGRFDVTLSGLHWMFRIIERMINLRSCFTAVATGDQAIFVNRLLFEKIGGFPEIPLMEDIALSKRLRKVSRPVCIHDRVITSSRRWEEKGILSTILLMWKLRLLYFLGVAPARLAAMYRTGDRKITSYRK